MNDALARLSKCVALIGSDTPGERDNALWMVDKGLLELGLSWTAISEMVARGHDAKREKLFAELLAARLRSGIIYAWTMMGQGDVGFVRVIAAQCDAGAVVASIEDIYRAIAICDEARRLGGVGGADACRKV